MRTLAVTLVLASSIAHADASVPSLRNDDWAWRCVQQIDRATTVWICDPEKDPLCFPDRAIQLRDSDGRWQERRVPHDAPPRAFAGATGVALDGPVIWVVRVERTVLPPGASLVKVPPNSDSGWTPVPTTGGGYQRMVIRNRETFVATLSEVSRDLHAALDACIGSPAPSTYRSRFAGRWDLRGEPTRDTCGHRAVLFAHHLDISADGWKLVADGDGGDAAAYERDGVLIAEGFRTVPHEPAIDTWTLRYEGDALVGTLDSSWEMPSLPKTKRCSVTFALRATRSP